MLHPTTSATVWDHFWLNAVGKKGQLLYWVSSSITYVWVIYSSCSTEKCDEDNLGSVGSSRGKHKAQCGQTGGKPSAEQHAQHQYRTDKSQHTGGDTSKCFCNHKSNVLWVHVTETISLTLSIIRRSICPLGLGFAVWNSYARAHADSL